ncbi:MAG: MMPL family transporter [Planctomycetes bacterium]|nr:MMPL family transporter [Planctomycetota bacterium]
MRKDFFARYSLLILMAFFFAVPLLMQGAHRAVRSNTNKVVDWLPKTFKETQELRWFRKHFTADQFVIVTWPGCELGDDPALTDGKKDDPRIEQLAKYLVPKEKASSAERSRWPEHTKYFQAVTTARRTLDDITSKPSEVPYDEAVKRLQGTLIGPDARQTCVVVMLSDEAIKNFRSVVGRRVPDGPLPWQRKLGVLIESLEACGIDPETARLGGPPIENVAIDEEGDKTLSRLALLSGGLGVALAWWSLRSVKLTLMVFTCAVLSAATGLAFVFWTGQTTDAVMMSMPSMLYVLAISGAVHLVNYYHDAIREHGIEGAAERALAHGWKPALLCNVTTGIGLASLATADLEPIRKFGLYSAAGVALMLIFLFFFLPSALTMWPVPLTRKQRRDEHEMQIAGLSDGRASRDLWTRLSTGIIRHHTAVSLACFAFIIAIGCGLMRVHTNIDLLKLFDESVRVRRDYAYLEEHIGRLVPMEVVVEFPAEKRRAADEKVAAAEAATRSSFLERYELVDLIQQTIDKELGPAGRNLVGPSLSPITFGPLIPAGSKDVARRNVTNVKLEESETALKRSGYLETDPETNTELWRVSLRAAAFANLDYGSFVNSVRAVIEPVLAAQRVREKALQQVAANREDESLAGGAVCLWNPGDSNAPPMTVSVETPAYRKHVFANATQELLDRARLKLQRFNGDLSKFTNEQREAVVKKFKSFDCVVAIGNIPDADIQAMNTAGVRLVDARRELVPSGEASPVAMGVAMPAPIKAVYTGVVPIVYKAQRALLDNLIQSSFWSFVTITPLIMIVCRSVRGGAVVMLPNVLPVLVIFGGMGWLGISVDIGSMMAASIALGVAVDDTIHYLTWYREALDQLGDRHKAIIHAYRRCAAPTLQAALISGLGLSVFAFSTFTPTQKMGWLMMTILIAGVIAELVMMPAILAGPLGTVFKPRPKTAPASVPTPHVPKRKTQLVSSRS